MSNYKRLRDRYILNPQTELYNKINIDMFVPDVVVVKKTFRGDEVLAESWAPVSKLKTGQAIRNDIAEIIKTNKYEASQITHSIEVIQKVLSISHFISRPSISSSQALREIRNALVNADPYIALFARSADKSGHMERYFSVLEESPKCTAKIAALADFETTYRALKARKKSLICETYEATRQECVYRLRFSFTDLDVELSRTEYEGLVADLKKIGSNIEDLTAPEDGICLIEKKYKPLEIQSEKRGDIT